MLNANAQEHHYKVTVTDPDTVIYTSVQHLPEFPGGLDGLNAYLVKAINYPASAVKNKIQGKVLVQVVIEKDGSASHAEILRGQSDDLDKEAIRVLTNSPKWTPALQNGKAVRMHYVVPVSFKLHN